VEADRTAEPYVRACVLALAGVAILFASPALAEGTCLIEVDGQRSLDGPCAVRTARQVIFFDRRGGGLSVAVMLDQAHADRGEADRTNAAGWHEQLGPVHRDGPCWIGERVKFCASGQR
jgi:hypothetical protein